MRSLLLTGWLFLCSLLIFTSMGMAFFNDHFTSDTDTNPCHDLVLCYIEMAWMGIIGGGAINMDVVGYADGRQYYQRVMFDLAFFIVVGVLLFNMVTGIIIDTFASCREETDERMDTLENMCFITGLTRDKMEDMGLDFDGHVENLDTWNYLYFYAYLLRKDSSEYNGAESELMSQIERGEPGWLPVRTSYAIQQQNALLANETTVVEQKVAALAGTVDVVREDVAQTREDIAGMKEMQKELAKQLRAIANVLSVVPGGGGRGSPGIRDDAGVGIGTAEVEL
jgi:inositol 1,4,5-triphosphate receptor type 1/inositol 1,4,5-triphosphate receptor type 3